MYLRMPDILKDENIVIIDATKSVEDVAEEVWDYVVKQLLE